MSRELQNEANAIIEQASMNDVMTGPPFTAIYTRVAVCDIRYAHFCDWSQQGKIHYI